MKSRVKWEPEATIGIALIWSQAADPKDITAIQDEINRLLTIDSVGNSTPVSEGLRSITIPPVRALVEISADGSVTVVRVSELR